MHALVALPAISRAEAEPLPRSLDRNRDGKITIACLGDSNTNSLWQRKVEGGFSGDRGWCRQLVASLADPRVRLVNLALGGATVGPNSALRRLEEKWRWEGDGQLRLALETEAPDVILMSFGTNDVLPVHGLQPSDIVDAYNRLWRRTRARDLLGLVALTPRNWPHARSGKYRRSPTAIDETNVLLRETFSPRHVLAFDAVDDRADFIDHLHHNEAGQTKRAREARDKLLDLARVTPPPVGVRSLRFSGGHWSSGSRDQAGSKVRGAD